jgi:hypothetical protein
MPGHRNICNVPQHFTVIFLQVATSLLGMALLKLRTGYKTRFPINLSHTVPWEGLKSPPNSQNTIYCVSLFPGENGFPIKKKKQTTKLVTKQRRNFSLLLLKAECCVTLSPTLKLYTLILCLSHDFTQ